jgi:hypothetical protein
VSQSIPAPAADQLHYLKRSLAQQPGLPFADLLPANTNELLGDSSDPIYTPAVTRAMFLCSATTTFPHERQLEIRSSVGHFFSWAGADSVAAFLAF